MYAVAFDLVVADTEEHHAKGVWFPKSVRDIRAFRIEQWSDFTAVVKG
jgi:virulence-associated protein VapD